MTPTNYRRGCASEEIRFSIGETTLGTILVASSAKGVAATLLGDDPEALVRDLPDRFPTATLIGADLDYAAIVEKVVGLVDATSFVPAWLDRDLFPFQSRLVDIDGSRIHYVDEGDGPALLMLHDNPT